MSNLIINDPIYGFTSIPRGLLTKVLVHSYFQRLGRIRQLGMAPFVYPGALHTRAAHSLGAFHLMQEALLTLQRKGLYIFDSEIEAAEAAILLHDVGHGPFSHVLERTLLTGVSHEEISLLLMRRLNEELGGDLTMAINVFENKQCRTFLHQLVSSQLDVDRLDYLCRDSFYCGVREGHIGAERLIAMMVSENNHLLLEHKGLYTVENYLMARRLMYWQVYLHKTVVAAEMVLLSTLKRAKFLSQNGVQLFASPALKYFLDNVVRYDDFIEGEALEMFVMLDDADIITSLKVWMGHNDKILSMLSSFFINRKLFKVEVRDSEITSEELETKKRMSATALGLSVDEASYFVASKSVNSMIYSRTVDPIVICNKDQSLNELSSVSSVVRQDLPYESRTYLFYPREIL